MLAGVGSIASSPAILLSYEPIDLSVLRLAVLLRAHRAPHALAHVRWGQEAAPPGTTSAEFVAV